MSQCVPHFERVLAEITRVLKPGGRLHLLTEDYAMLHMPRGERLPERLWVDTALPYLHSLGCDGAIGRHTPPLLELAGYSEIAMDYIVVDTLRVPRAVFAGILVAWRDGFVDPLAASSGRSQDDVRADFDNIIHAIETPPNYAVWQVPVASGRRPA
jgi:ubiquinone/menaquinone biosynthesis C-methylase UbiE